MTGTTQAEHRIGYCPLCGVTLRITKMDESPWGHQVTCRCRNVVLSDAEVKKWGGMRPAWEVAVGLKSKWSG